MTNITISNLLTFHGGKTYKSNQLFLLIWKTTTDGGLIGAVFILSFGTFVLRLVNKTKNPRGTWFSQSSPCGL